MPPPEQPQDPAAPAPGTPYTIPPEGSLGLLALGYRGLVAWRAVRGLDWIEERRADHEAGLARATEKAAAEKAAADAAGGVPEEPPQAAPGPPAEAAAAPVEPEPGALEGAALVVVSGLPRSGTSMLMQMLVAGGLGAFVDGARVADDSNPRGYFEHERVKALARDRGWVPDAHGHVVKVVAPLLPHLPAGPAYRVVFLERDLDEVLRSQAAMLARLGRPSAAPAVLRPVYARHLAAARAWMGGHPRTDVLLLPHRDVVADPAGTAARLNAFLGGALDEAAMAAVVDPSLHRERG